MPTAPPSSPSTTPAPSSPPIASVKTNLSFSLPNLGQAINTPNQHSLDPHPLNSLAGLGTSYGTSPFLPRSELDRESEISTSAPASLASILASQVSINGYRNIDNIQQVSSSPLTSPRRSNLLLNLQSPSASPVPSSPPFPTPTPADPDQQPRSPRLNPNFNSGSFNPFQSLRSSQGHEDTLDGDPPNQVAPFSLSEPQTPRNSTGSSPVSCAGDWARCMQVSCPAGTGLHLIIEPQIPRCLTWTFTSSSSNSDSRDHFTINISMPHQSRSAVPDANDEEPAVIRATCSASRGQGAIAQAPRGKGNAKAAGMKTTTNGPKKPTGTTTSSTSKPTPKAQASKLLPKAQASKPPPKAQASKVPPKAQASKPPPKAQASKAPPKAPASKAPAKAPASKAPPKVPPARQGNGPSGGLPQGSTTKKQAKATAQPMDIDGLTAPAPSTKTLKRKPDAPHAVSRTGSNSEEMDLDNVDIDADEVPRPKKSKPSLPSKPTVAGKGRQASTTASASRSASSTALNSPVTSSHTLPSVTDQPSKGQKKGAASQKAAHQQKAFWDIFLRKTI
ncbi:hypothetical protein FRC04_003926, partial [Tulasnella sp. 424]